MRSLGADSYLSRLLKHLAPSACVAAVVLCASVASVASQTPVNIPDLQKAVKDAAKLTRSGALVEAEAALRKAIEIDTTRSEAKVELAYVLVKQRRLREAYDIVFAVAKAEPNNARAFAVLGMTLLTAGRFSDARVILLNAI